MFSPYGSCAGVGRLTDPRIGTALLMREVVFVHDARDESGVEGSV
jgi:hypothetical protein